MGIKQHFNPHKHGIYVPKNPEKYKGRLPIITRSGWENQVCQWLDINPSILEWASESLSIQYFNPIKQTISRYYPDFVVKVRNKEGNIDTLIIEVKPFKETRPPDNRGKKSIKTKLNEEKKWIVNKSKWKAAVSYCERHGYKFKLLTEKELFNR
jgi:hypothetical protein